MNYVVLDLEMNSWQSRTMKTKSGQYFIIDGNKKVNLETTLEEIIEIGAVKLDENMRIIDTFQRFVKPINKLTQFIKKLTHISQNDVDNAKPFVDVMEEFLAWIGSDSQICTWSTSDRKQLIKESKHKEYFRKAQVEQLFLNYVDVQKLFRIEFQKRAGIFSVGMKNDYGLKTTMQILGINSGTHHHRALDDAMDTTDIFISIHNGYLDYVTDVFRKESIA
jgi:inhibitor of KinA sporulation pathway (predicted exonuclease)